MLQLLKPNWKNILLAVLLMAVLFNINIPLGLTYTKADGTLIYTSARGLPVPLFMTDFDGDGNPFYWDDSLPDYPLPYRWLLFDIIFWYIASCVMVSMYSRIRNKQKFTTD